MLERPTRWPTFWSAPWIRVYPRKVDASEVGGCCHNLERQHYRLDEQQQRAFTTIEIRPVSVQSKVVDTGFSIDNNTGKESPHVTFSVN